MFKLKIIIKNKQKGDVEMSKTKEEKKEAQAKKDIEAAKKAQEALTPENLHREIDIVEISHAENVKKILHKIVDFIEG